MLWFTGMMQRDNWPFFSALRYLTYSGITKAHGPFIWQRSEFTDTGSKCREQSTKVSNVVSRVWKSTIYIYFIIVKGEHWLVLCLVLSSQDFFSLSPAVSCRLCHLSCRHWNTGFAVFFFFFFYWQHSGRKREKNGEKKKLLKRIALQNLGLGILESQDHRIVCIWRGPWRSSSPTLLQ